MCESTHTNTKHDIVVLVLVCVLFTTHTHARALVHAYSG